MVVNVGLAPELSAIREENHRGSQKEGSRGNNNQDLKPTNYTRTGNIILTKLINQIRQEI